MHDRVILDGSASFDVLESAQRYGTLGDIEGLAQGTINPVDRRDVDRSLVWRMKSAVSTGEYNIATTQRHITWCVDTRLRGDGTRDPNPSGAGGVLSMVYGRALTPVHSIRATNEIEYINEVVGSLNDQGIPTGVHGGDHSTCDCGACAKAPLAIARIAHDGTLIRTAVASLGIDVDDAQHSMLVESASSIMSDDRFFATDRKLAIDAAVARGSTYEHLVGVHNELLLAVNYTENTTVQREQVYADYGDNYGLFVLDAWALEPSARLLSPQSDIEQQQLVAAMAYYNVAVASLLCGPSMPIVPVHYSR